MATVFELHTLSTAEAPKMPLAKAVQKLQAFYEPLANVAKEERRALVAKNPTIEEPAFAYGLWTYTPLALSLESGDTGKAEEVALAVVEYGSSALKTWFLWRVIANAGHPGIQRTFASIVAAGYSLQEWEYAVGTIASNGNELHAFNLIHLMAWMRGKAPHLEGSSAANGVTWTASQSQRSFVREATVRAI